MLDIGSSIGADPTSHRSIDRVLSLHTVVLLSAVTTQSPSPGATATLPPAATAAAPLCHLGANKRPELAAGDLINVVLQHDLGSRTSAVGDTFAVTTADDVAVCGKLMLPKGSPGYGTVTHVKRAGMFHAGGELAFSVDRLVASDGTIVPVTTDGATADADRASERNGNALVQAVLFRGVSLIAKRGNDMFIKQGTTFHVAVTQATPLAVVRPGEAPAPIDLAAPHTEK